jgi:transforming growth factor-beta-induced protein
MNLKRFVTFIKHAMLVAIVITTVGLTGCDKDDEEPAPTKTVWELVQENADLTMLEEQLLEAELDGTLSGSGNFTLFAPSDAAMSNLLSTLGLDDFGSVSSAVRDAVLAYHVSNSQYLAAALTNGVEITTLQGEKIKVVTTTTGEKTLDTGATSDSKVTQSDVKATNGVIHIVDVVLVPPTVGALIVETLGTVAQPLLLGSEFTILAEGLIKANDFAVTAGIPTLTDILINEAPGTEDFIYTVFAPTNATFNAASITAASFTGQQWYGIISHHIVASNVTFDAAADFEPAGTQFNTLATATTTKKLTVLTTNAPTNPGAGITTGIALDSNGDTTPNAQIAVLDVLTATGANPAQNGVINVIAGVLSPN